VIVETVVRAVWGLALSCCKRTPEDNNPIVTKFEFSQQLFQKYLNIKFHENPSSRSRVVSRGQTDGRMDGQVV